MRDYVSVRDIKRLFKPLLRCGYWVRCYEVNAEMQVIYEKHERRIEIHVDTESHIIEYIVIGPCYSGDIEEDIGQQYVDMTSIYEYSSRLDALQSAKRFLNELQEHLEFTDSH